MEVAATISASHITDCRINSIWKMDVLREMQIQSFAFLFGSIRVASKVPKVGGVMMP